MIDARKAREIANVPDPDFATEKVKELLKKVAQSAAEGKRQYLEDYDQFWVREGFSPSESWKVAVKMLEDRGFKVHYYYSSVQMRGLWLKVEW